MLVPRLLILRAKVRGRVNTNKQTHISRGPYFDYVHEVLFTKPPSAPFGCGAAGRVGMAGGKTLLGFYRRCRWQNLPKAARMVPQTTEPAVPTLCGPRTVGTVRALHAKVQWYQWG